MDDAIAGADFVDLVVLPGEPGAAEHEVELLRGTVRVRRRRELARRDADPVHADADGARSAPEPLPEGIHLAFRGVMLVDVVPVHDRAHVTEG